MSKIISPSLALCACLLLANLASSSAFAQAAKAGPAQSVLAAPSAEQVRFTALGEVYQLRLEVFSAAGERLFDSDFKPGNLLDWHLQDQQGQRLAEGAYRCVVTTKNLAGQTSQKHGLVLLQADQVTLQAPGPDAQAIQAANALPTLGQSDSLTLLGKESLLPLTLLAHDGEQGRVLSGRGGLSFRTGDFFAGKDQEQMRLTADGKLGLGVTDPQAKLDVGGLIRTSEGIVFPDGTVQTTAYVASGRSLNERSFLQRAAADRLVELTEPAQKNSAGGLGPPVNTNIPDDLVVNGNLIFTPAPARDITMQNNNSGLRFYGAPTLTNSPAAAAIQFWGNNSNFPGQLYLDAGATNLGALIFRTALAGGTIAERMRVTASGNVGIGTAAPESRLHIADQNALTVDGYQPFLTMFDAGATNSPSIRLQSAGGDSFFLTGSRPSPFLPYTYTTRLVIRRDGGVLAQSSSSGLSNSAVRAENSHPLGIGMWAVNNSADATLVVSNVGPGDLFRGFSSGSGGPVFSVRNDGGVSIGTASARGKLDLAGNAVQDRGSNGLVKAMAFVNPFGSNKFERCYNSQLTGTAATTPPCGFTYIDISGEFPFVLIDFGFQVDDRFVSVTPTYSGGENTGANISYAGNSVYVHIFYSGEILNKTYAPFTIIVY
jgi:hypothetical protein